jgi:hypothetical protein
MRPSASQASIQSRPPIEICILCLAHPARIPHLPVLRSVEPIGLARGLRFLPDLKSIRLRGSAVRVRLLPLSQT